MTLETLVTFARERNLEVRLRYIGGIYVVILHPPGGTPDRLDWYTGSDAELETAARLAMSRASVHPKVS